MKGAIIGDIIGSIYECHNYKGNVDNLTLFREQNFFTDDTICTCGIAAALLKPNPTYKDYQEELTKYCLLYPDGTYGPHFINWLYSTYKSPYESFGNGALSRISAIPYYYLRNEKDLWSQVDLATSITHNHPQALLATQCFAKSILILKNTKDFIGVRHLIDSYYEIPKLQKLDHFNINCQETMSVCYSIFFNSNGFEDAMRKSIWVGGDTDTNAAIVGSLAEAYWGIPKAIEDKMWDYLDDNIKNSIKNFELSTK